MANHQNQTLISHALANSSQAVELIVVPLPIQGHLNQLLHLARLVAGYGISVHYVCSATHLRQAKHRVHGWNPNSVRNVHFHSISVPEFLSPPPDPDAGHAFPSHLLPAIRAVSEHLRLPVRELVLDLSNRAKRVIVVHDSLMKSAVRDAESVVNAEAYTFHTVSAFAIFLFLLETRGFPLPEEAGKHVPENVPSLEGCFPRDFMEFIEEQYGFRSFSSGNLLNTSRVMEKPYINLLDKILEGKRNWAIGPFNPVDNIDKAANEKHKGLEWLDKQAPKSVVYVSFGTSTTFTNQQIGELALGLERSNQKFIWVLRDADKGDLFNDDHGDHKATSNIELPLGFEERVRDVGFVVRDWAPQLDILGHPSTGGFVSHCGWNSCLESITMGVPIGAWPVHSDQPRNTVLVTEVLGVGTIVREWKRRDELAKADEVAAGVVGLMASEEGTEARRRAEEFGAVVRRSVADENGVSRKELDSFIAHITR